jgi:hypothetical protein
MLALATTASASDPLEIRGRPQVPVRVRIEIPASLSALRFGVGIGGAGALIESSQKGLDLVVRSATGPVPATPRTMDRLEGLLDRSPFNIGDAGPSEPGLRLDLFTPGDVGVSLKYRW